jgi:ketopantoate reductase
MVTVDSNAHSCTMDMMSALEQMIGGDSSLAVVYGNSAIAAVILVFQAHGIDLKQNRDLFQEIWSPIAGTAIMLE